MWSVAWLSQYVSIPLTWAVSLAFVLLYSCLQPWWRHSIGWTLVTVDGGIFATLTPHMLKVWFGFNDSAAWFQWFIFTVFMCVPAGIAARLIILGVASRWQFRLPWNHPAPKVGRHAVLDLPPADGSAAGQPAKIQA